MGNGPAWVRIGKKDQLSDAGPEWVDFYFHKLYLFKVRVINILGIKRGKQCELKKRYNWNKNEMQFYFCRTPALKTIH